MVNIDSTFPDLYLSLQHLATASVHPLIHIELKVVVDLYLIMLRLHRVCSRLHLGETTLAISKIDADASFWSRRLRLADVEHG